MDKAKKTRSPYTILASSKLFWMIIIFFILESLWIVFSAIYPMAFDEDFHFGLIKLYSHYWLPFLPHQPTGTSIYGAVTHDPSYLYHYLMSFPYRFIEIFTNDQTIRVIWLRLLNVALFTYSLVLFRKLMLRAGTSRAATNVSILIFVLLPIVPQLAATINYDNLFMVLVAFTGLVLASCIAAIKVRQLPLRQLGILTILCFLGSIVKYPFLPVAAASIIILLMLIWQSFNHDIHAIQRATHNAFRELSKPVKVALLIAILASAGLFSQRYVVNLVSYGSPIPTCNRVLTTDDCMQYGPFARNYIDAQERNTAFKPRITTFSKHWVYGLWYRTFFAINGNISTPRWVRYQVYPPLPYPSFTLLVLVASSILLVLLLLRRVFNGDWLILFFLLMATLYLCALYVTNYVAYEHTGEYLGINGRYLLPIMLPCVIIAIRAWSLALHNQAAKYILASIVVLLFLQGGGFLTFILGSNKYWYWPNHTVYVVNTTAQNVAQKLVLNHHPLNKLHAP